MAWRVQARPCKTRRDGAWLGRAVVEWRDAIWLGASRYGEAVWARSGRSSHGKVRFGSAVWAMLVITGRGAVSRVLAVKAVRV